MNYTHGMLEIFAALIIMVLLIESHFISKPSKRSIVLNILLFNLFALLIADAISYLTSLSGKMGLTSEIFFLISTCLAYNLIGVFNYYIVINIKDKKKVSMWLGHIGIPVALAGSLMWISSHWTGAVYSITYGEYTRGSWFWISQLISLFLIAYDFILIVIFYEYIGKRDSMVFIAYLASLVASLGMREIFPPIGIPVVYLTVTLSVIALYTILHIDQNIELKEKEEKLAKSRVAIMLRQIQPHFLYNALNVIYYLCEKDSLLAQEAISEFADYLRGNLDSIAVDRAVPFDRELTHVRNYLFLEKLRYEDELEIEYDLRITDFNIPPLTVQPLVENAVRYGIGQSAEGGKVIIRTLEEGGYYRIEVIDNGVGGYNENEEKNDGRSHIGVKNVRERLELMIGGSLDIESSADTGTKAVILIPKFKQAILV